MKLILPQRPRRTNDKMLFLQWLQIHRKPVGWTGGMGYRETTFMASLLGVNDRLLDHVVFQANV